MADLYFIVPGTTLAAGGAEEVGNKAWNLMRMAQKHLPVPPAFVLPPAGAVAPAKAMTLRCAKLLPTELPG